MDFIGIIIMNQLDGFNSDEGIKVGGYNIGVYCIT